MIGILSSIFFTLITGVFILQQIATIYDKPIVIIYSLSIIVTIIVTIIRIIFQ